MNILTITLNNWVCYAGVQILELNPQAYSVTAKRTDNPGRSNWAGKTSFLQAPVFALFGEHNARTEDGWITEGAEMGAVALTMQDGQEVIHIERSRKRGKSTQLNVRVLPGGVEKKGDEAQRFIESRLGLTAADFRATCYFAQKQMARLVTAKPQERMDIIGAWLRLDPLIAAEEEVGRQLVALSGERERLSAKRAVAKAMLDNAYKGRTADDIQDQYDEKKREYEKAVEAKELLDDKLQAARQLATVKARAEEYTRICDAGLALREEVNALNIPALTKAAEDVSKLEREQSLALMNAQRDVQQKRVIARGQFDGACPLAAIACPAKDEINRKGQAARDALAAAEETVQECQKRKEFAETQWKKVEAHRQAAERQVVRLESLREQAKALKLDYELAKDAPDVSVSELEAEWTRASNRMVDLKGALDALQKDWDDSTKAEEAIVALDAPWAEVEAKAGVLREALVVFGKTGAQKRVAEAALQAIEEGANGMLEECGIDLNVEVQWSRQGEGLAKACDQCGNPFGTSAKVKQCERCGAARGPLLVNKLDLVLSDRSGAAEDLAGAAIQLAASAWLRGERNSAWSTALLDEPFGALDEYNRKAFASHLASMLSGRYGFSQAFVVSHTADTTFMLPGRIEITNENGRATARVVA